MRTSTPSTALRVMERRWHYADLYLLFNEGPQPVDQTLTLSSAPGRTQLWDPQTGSIHSLATTNHHGLLTVTLHFVPYATRVVVVQSGHRD